MKTLSNYPKPCLSAWRSLAPNRKTSTDPYTAHFIQADSIIPPGAQGLDRYAYVNNNPINYTDPSGHIVACEAAEDCKEVRRTSRLSFDDAFAEAFTKYDATLDGRWDKNNKIAILLGILYVGTKFASVRGIGESASDAFKAKYDPITFKKVYSFEYQGGTYKAGCKTEGSIITCASMVYGYLQSNVNNIVHELGHAFDPGSGIPGVFIENRNDILHVNDTVMWQSNTTHTSAETFGDFFVAWVFDVWGTKADDVWKKYPSVNSAKHWMTTSMSDWLQP